MICPYCGTEMEQGFIQSPRGRFMWTLKRKIVFVLPLKENDVILGSNGWFSDVIDASLCRNCKKVIADYADGK